MKRRKDEWEQMMEEHGKCRNQLALWVILRDGRIWGRITSRHPSQGKTTCVTLEMYPTACTPSRSVSGYESKHGCIWSEGTNAGMAEILMRKREELKAYYGMELPDSRETLRDYWEMFVGFGKYEVVRVM